MNLPLSMNGPNEYIYDNSNDYRNYIKNMFYVNVNQILFFFSHWTKL